MDNQNIIKSLKSLESSLKEIDAARSQVQTVTNGAKELSNVISKYSEALDKISESIKSILQDTKNFNLETLNTLDKKILEIQTEASKIAQTISSSLQKFKTDGASIIEEMKGKISKSITPIDATIKDLNDSSFTLKKEIDRMGELNFQNKLELISTNISKCDDKIDSSVKNVTKSIIDQYGILDTKIDNSFTNVTKSINSMQTSSNKESADIKNAISDIEQKIEIIYEETQQSEKKSKEALKEIKTEISKNTKGLADISALLKISVADIQKNASAQKDAILKRVTVFGVIIILIECISVAIRLI